MARIIHVCPRYVPARGGAETFFRKLSEALVSDGHEVTVWTTDALTVPAFMTASGQRLATGPESIGGVTVRRFPVRYVPLQKWVRTAAHVLPFGQRWKCDTLRWTPWVPSMTRAAMRHAGPVDLVHAAGLPYSSLLHAGVTLAERTGARLVITPFTHVPAPGRAGRPMQRAYLSPLNMRILRRADAVFVQTMLERRVLAQGGVSSERQALVGVGISPLELVGGDRRRSREAWRVTGHVPVVGHLGNKSWDKGTMDLLTAAERLWARGLEFRVVLAGPAMPGFDAYLRAHPCRDRVVNLPELSDGERRDFFAGIDVFALPSYVESFGLSALEAAWCGSAVVAYDHGGPSEIFEHGVSALLAPAADIGALSAAVESVVVDGDLRARLAVAGRRVAEQHEWDRALGRATDAYANLLGG
jgi:glycosyltransferase involved in cell wall biosynthesis